MFRKVVYSDDVEQTERNFYDLLDQFGTKYEGLKAYLSSLFEYKERWCISYRNDLVIRGNNTNNFVESQFLVLKDNILNRTKEVQFIYMYVNCKKITCSKIKTERISLDNYPLGQFKLEETAIELLRFSCSPLYFGSLLSLSEYDELCVNKKRTLQGLNNKH